MTDILDKLANNIKLEKEEIVYLLGLENFSDIYNIANKINYDNFKNIVNIRAILEFSNYCKRKCIYCGLNSTVRDVPRYRMNIEEIIDVVQLAYDAGYKTIVLQSGEDPYYTSEKIGIIIKNIKSRMDIAITVSCGEMSYDDYKYIKDCGADRYLLKHETSDDKIYSYLHSCGTLKNRLNCLKNLKQLGYYTGSGFMIGLPNQTLDTIAQDIITLTKIPCDMAGIGPFIASKNTILKDLPNGSIELTKRAVALTRIMLPKAHLPATTSLGVLSSKEKNNIFSCGANVIMRKVTPQKYEEYYNIYPNNIKVNDILKDRIELENQIISIGKIPV